MALDRAATRISGQIQFFSVLQSLPSAIAESVGVVRNLKRYRKLNAPNKKSNKDKKRLIAGENFAKTKIFNLFPKRPKTKHKATTALRTVW